MHSHGKWFVVPTLVLLGGCFFGYGYHDFDGKGPGGAGGENTNPASAVSSNSSNASSGGGGGGGVSCPDMPDVLCDNRPAGCPMQDCFRLEWAAQAGNASSQRAVAAATDTMLNVAIAGNYHDLQFSFGNLSTELSGSIAEGPYTEAFVALYDAAGKAKWAQSVGTPNAMGPTNRRAVGVGFLSPSKIIVAGNEYIGADPTQNQAIFQVYEATTGNLVSAGMKVPLRMDIMAMTTDNQDAYAVGVTHESGTVDCNGQSAIIKVGMIVFKVNNAGQCMWVRSMQANNFNNVIPTAIAAHPTANKTVWITGQYSSQLDFGGGNAITPTGVDTFVASLSKLDGVPESVVTLDPDVGTIYPQAIDFDDAQPNGTTTVFLGGKVVGPVSILSSTSLVSTQSAAFVASLDVALPPTGMPCTAATRTAPDTLLLASNTDATAGATISRLIRAGTHLYAAGTFAQEISNTLNSSGLKLAYAGESPFLVTVGTSPMKILGLDYFPTAAAAGKFMDGSAWLAGNETNLVLVGGWSYNLDLTTANAPLAPNMTMPANGQLTALGMAPTTDIYISRFTPLH